MILAIDHVQLAIPSGAEEMCRRFYVADPLGNRLEFMERQSD